MAKEYANIRVSLEVKTKIDELSDSFGTADNALRSLLGLTLTKDKLSQNVQSIPMQLMIVVVLNILQQGNPLERREIVEAFEAKLLNIPNHFKKDRQVLPSNFRPRWYSKLGNAINQGRRSGFIDTQKGEMYSGKAKWRITAKGEDHLSRTQPLVIRAAADPGSSFILNLLQ